MLRYLTWDALNHYPKLRDSMFLDRATQFRARLKWEVTVDQNGFERDQYDGLPGVIYTIWERPDGTHGGSMRFLPTTGRTMLAEHFSSLTQGVEIASPHIWECTRFCLAPGAGNRTAPALMLAGLDLGLGHGLSHSVGVFDAPMVRIYARLGWPPAVLGTQGSGRTAISAGLWAFEPALRPVLLRRARVSAKDADRWYAQAFEGGVRAA
ncbi:MAG: acyl-homoserine-lactone synthase [Pseudomonadota bacterium]